MIPLLAGLAFGGACPEAPLPGPPDTGLDGWVDRTGLAREHARAEIAALEGWAFPEELDEETREGIRTDGLVIVRDGAILYERYGRDWTADKPHLLWSASKSVTNSLLGMAVAEGRLDLDASICEARPFEADHVCAITPRHLVEFSSGLAWRETYEGESPRVSSVIAMLFGEGREDVAAFVASHPPRDPPGTSYQYSSGDTNLLAAVVHAALEPAHGARYPWERLFEPLGITSAVFERDGQGVYLGSSYLYLTPRDMARYGTFLLHDGCWDGARMLPEGWVGRVREPAASLHGRIVERDEGDVPGWNVWLNQPLPHLDEPVRPWPEGPPDVFAPMGHWKQAVYVVPSHDLVIARTGDDRHPEGFRHGDLLFRAIALAEAVPRAGEYATPGAGSEAPAADEASEALDEASEALDEASEALDEASEALDEASEAAEELAARWRRPLPEPAADAPWADPPDKYDLGLLKIASSYAARMACSCLFVSGRSEEACRRYIRVSPDVARIKVDREARTVRARSLGFAKVVARYVGPEAGCTLEE